MYIVDDVFAQPSDGNSPPTMDKRGTLEQCIIIDGTEVSRQVETLRVIRSDVTRFLTPAFLLHSEGDEARCLSDGCVSSVEDAHKRAGLIVPRMAELSTLPTPIDDTDRLLRFLYTRPGFEVKPIRDWKDAHTYRYPLLDALREFETDCRTWLSVLEKSDLIEPVADIVDRVRHCPGCGWTHVNYVDLCPTCGSLQIRKGQFLHCFACGFVAEERLFQATDGRACPKCARTLRHIGIDYDRALQNFTCAECASSFSDASISARCLHCDRHFEPAQLCARDVRIWRLSRAGRLAARPGAATSQASDSLALILSDKRFTEFLDWALRTRQRYAQTQFGLIRICLDRDESAYEGASDRDLMQALWQRVRTTVRSTEVLGWGAGNSLWVFCPCSGADSLIAIRQRIQSLAETIDGSLTGSATLQVTLTQSDDVLVGDRADTLLRRVAQSRQGETP